MGRLGFQADNGFVNTISLRVNQRPDNRQLCFIRVNTMKSAARLPVNSRASSEFFYQLLRSFPKRETYPQ
jgi:hypothetical protein